ncbi:tetratricopeptide repeat protein [Arsenophonus sp.]|uniref:tetratricopeptide repeat protein n=1 Tax=Arsenophonus sp. TaxID=1872640 RepID=UPI00286264BA|nr:tetratricopeptide repeat protein [Arsenophonus sp.]MDR5617049.1 tetratricopeptide repeat protein [Arsenophonus sp.]
MTNKKRLIITLFISYFFHIKLTITNSLIINNIQVNKIKNKNYVTNIFIAINKKDWQQIENHLNQLIKNNYHDKSLIYFMQGLLSYKNRELQSAIHYLSQAITINPHFTRAKLDLSYIYIENRIYHKAKPLLNELIAQQDLPELVKKKIKYLLIVANNKNSFFATFSLGYHLTDNLNRSPGSPAECLKKILRAIAY